MIFIIADTATARVISGRNNFAGAPMKFCNVSSDLASAAEKLRGWEGHVVLAVGQYKKIGTPVMWEQFKRFVVARRCLLIENPDLPI